LAVRVLRFEKEKRSQPAAAPTGSMFTRDISVNINSVGAAAGCDLLIFSLNIPQIHLKQ
jgi:hypothetical protein